MEQKHPEDNHGTKPDKINDGVIGGKDASFQLLSPFGFPWGFPTFFLLVFPLYFSGINPHDVVVFFDFVLGASVTGEASIDLVLPATGGSAVEFVQVVDSFHIVPGGGHLNSLVSHFPGAFGTMVLILT